MSEKIGKLKLNTHEGILQIAFYCPGCKSGHNVNDHGWKYNGDPHKPTITPSIKVSYGENPPAELPPYCCHSYVTDGKIQFLADCTHELAGQTVDLPDYPEWYG